ncbi:MAG: HAD family hydrolase [Ktedonobacteraceae bacterium]
MSLQMLHAVILDVDGTLIDSNDAHAHAWLDAMAEYGHHVPFEKIRPLIGMGGDKVLPEVLGIDKDSEEGKKISAKRKELVKTRYLSTIKSFPKAKELLEHMHACGLKLVIATSAEPDEIEQTLKIVGPHIQDLMEKQLTSKDAKLSKPDSDIMEATLKQTGCSPSEVVMLGDTPYDIEAAAKAGIKSIGLRSGGWDDKDLSQAIAIYTDTADLLTHYNTSPLANGIPL